MNFPSFDDPFGKKKSPQRPPVKAPPDLNWDAIEAKIQQRKQPAGTGEPKYDSSGYLGRMREEDPWPTQDEKGAVKVSLSNARFLTYSKDLLPDEPCSVASDVKVLQPPSSRTVLFRLQYRLAPPTPGTTSTNRGMATWTRGSPTRPYRRNSPCTAPCPLLTWGPCSITVRVDMVDGELAFEVSKTP